VAGQDREGKEVKMQTQKNERVERELGKLVRIASLGAIVPSVVEVRVFGSYNNGNWDPGRSDVDVFVETRDEGHSKLKNQVNNIIAADYLKKIMGEGVDFGIVILSTSDVGHYLQSRGPGSKIVVAAKKGRLLYKNELPFLN
jgi:predicted nucleotidyltransferase